MGLLDVKIDIKRGSHWKGRNRRIERLRTRSIANSEPSRSSLNFDSNNNASTSNAEQQWGSNLNDDHGACNYMDLELYQAATKDDVDGFIDVLEKVSTKRGLTLQAIWDSVSPLGNTVLHVAAGYGNEQIVRLIAYHSPSLLIKRNSKRDTALHVAAKKRSYLTVSTLIRPRRDYFDSCFSIEACREVDWDNLLLRLRNEEGNTALHEALISGDTMAAEDLIKADPEVSYYLNKEGKSSLYLAAEAGYLSCIRSMLAEPDGNKNPDERLKGKSPIHAAMNRRKRDILDYMLRKEPRFIHLRDEEGRTVLHCAASIGYLEGIRYLLGKYGPGAVQRDKNGFFPIHMASINGHIDVIQELLQHCHDPGEMLGSNDQNILHVAAKSGKLNVVRYILKNPELGKLINERDKDGNTSLHLATMHWHPKIVSVLTWDERVNLKLVNNEGLTALDAAEYFIERMASFRKRLTWTALRAGGAPRAPGGRTPKTDRGTSTRLEPPNMDNYKDRVNTLLLVSTLVATVTFAAGFTMPGGYNNSDPDQGMATMIRHHKFYVFVFCDTIAMYSSIIVAVSLIWAQLGDIHLVLYCP